jgi:hypothetical protein
MRLPTSDTRIETSLLAKHIGAERCRDLMIAALLIRLIASDRQETALLLLSENFGASFYAGQNNLLRESQLVAGISGDVACAIKLVCRQAGKPFVVDEFKTEEMIATGKTPAEISAALDAHNIRRFPNTLPIAAAPNTSLSAWLRNGR